MAVTTDYLEQKLQIRSNHGIVDGKEKITSRTYGDVKVTAANQDIYDVAVIIAGLQQPTLEEVVTLQANLLIAS